MITREQVADLRPGDVVELAVRSEVTGHANGELSILGGTKVIRWGDGRVPGWTDGLSLTVISRAARLYVNHDRAEPVPGDVVRDADNPSKTQVWWFTTNVAPWRTANGWTVRQYLPDRLRLLVDGETGQVVP